MGFYDYRCMVTGVSLKGAVAALVLLAPDGAKLRPIALPVFGEYNRLGAIDVKPDENSTAIWTFFSAEAVAGNVVGNENGLDWADCESLLGAIERGVTEADVYLTLAVEPISFALISQAIWRAIVSKTADDGVFRPHPTFARIYAGASDACRENAVALAQVDTFLRTTGCDWTKPIDPGQHYEEVRTFLDEAKRSFSQSPIILKGLADYEQEVAKLLADE